MLPEPYRVERVSPETHDTFTIGIAPANGSGIAPFAPGQFNMLYLFGVGELPISISGDAENPARLEFTVRSVGMATKALVTRRAGDTIGLRGPYGTAWPLDAARGKDLLLVAGGIGLAPLRPVIYHVLRHREDFVRLLVVYGARSTRDLLYRKELASWGRLPDTQVMSTVDYGGQSWRGHVGVVTTLFRHLRLHPDRTVAFVCGPEIMMRYAVRELQHARGVPQHNIWLSMERNMKCAVGFCGHCQYGPHFICKDGPVFSYSRIASLLGKDEL
jgi:NAD(P)H-flavin reductase